MIRVLADRHDVRLRFVRGLRSVAGEGKVHQRTLALAFPQTWMNESGASASALVRRYGISELSRLVVVHDELDLPVGRVRVKVGGGTAGHNGLNSVRAHLRDDGFVRVRIGIGKPPGRMEGADYVLRAASRSERSELSVAVQEAADAVEGILASGPEAAMNWFNAAR